MRLFYLFLVISAGMIPCRHFSLEKTASAVYIDTVVKPTVVVDTFPPLASLAPYSVLVHKNTTTLNAAPGTKSVLFDSKGAVLYAMNLEGMSVYAFDQQSRKLMREYKFKPTKGTGWDYTTNKPISSFQEKPVEACLSHDDKFLWVSLHNADGIVPIRVDSIEANRQTPAADAKKVYVVYPGKTKRDSIYVPLIETGKTPKIISRTADNGHLLVSNWHSNNVGVLATDPFQYPYARVVSTVPVSSIPRGIVVDDAAGRSFVAIMGGAAIAVVNNTTWTKEKYIPVEANPRHIVLDSAGRLFVSYNQLGRIACIDPNNGKTLFTAATAAQPRTILLSKNHKFLFVTCYSSDKVEVFRINDNSFTKIASLPCKGHPVGVDVYENDTTLEAWVCSYTNGTINIFTFAKK